MENKKPSAKARRDPVRRSAKTSASISARRNRTLCFFTKEDFITQKIKAVREQLESEIENLRQVNSELMKEIENQQNQLTLQGVELQSAKAIKNEVSGRFDQLNAELARAKEEIEIEKESATQSRMELVKAQLKLESVPRLEADLDQLYKNLEQERVAKLNAEHSAKSLATKLETEVAARKKAETELLDMIRDKKDTVL